jgi:hypothetical protein
MVQGTTSTQPVRCLGMLCGTSSVLYAKKTVPNYLADPGVLSVKRQDPLVVCKFFDPVGSWTWYATEGSPVDEDGYYDTDKEKVDYLFFGLVVGFAKELGYFSLTELQTLKEGMRGLRALPIERDVYFRQQRLSEIRRQHEDI